MVLDWIKDGTPVETAATYALDFVSEKAWELGFVEEWENLWGRRKNVQQRHATPRQVCVSVTGQTCAEP